MLTFILATYTFMAILPPSHSVTNLPLECMCDQVLYSDVINGLMCCQVLPVCCKSLD